MAIAAAIYLKPSSSVLHALRSYFFVAPRSAHKLRSGSIGKARLAQSPFSASPCHCFLKFYGGCRNLEDEIPISHLQAG
jgi:hypothetical protein